MLVKKDDAVAGEMYLPGATIKFSKTPTPVGEVPTPGQHPAGRSQGALVLVSRESKDLSALPRESS